MTTTMQLIAKQTVGAGGASSVTFSNIPDASKGYTDLKIVMSTRISYSNAFEQIKLNFNNDTGSNYSSILNLQGYNGSASSSAPTSRTFMYVGYTSASNATSSTFGSLDVYIPNYTSTTAAKSISVDEAMENNSSTDYVLQLNTSLWNPGTQAAINRIDVTPNNGTFAEFSTFYLYGISNSTTTQNTSVPYASGGDVITTNGTYWYHAFKYSGSFTPLKNLTADVLVVAGGGGGGTSGGGGGGGGAGGLLAFSAQSLTTQNYTCTVGAAGAGATTLTGAMGTQGGNSQFGALTASVGGGAGGGNGASGGNGGSGGGGAASGGSTSGGTATSGQGYNGGANLTSNPYPSGGGGGAGAVGQTAPSSTQSGAGGTGVNTYSSWLSATSTGASGYLAGGGGGGGGYTSSGAYYGANGNGGGGNGGDRNVGAAVNATANTGSGGGGSAGNGGGGAASAGGNGGSGIIIVRYAV